MPISTGGYENLLSSKEVAEVLTRRANGERTYTQIGVNRMVYEGRLKPVVTIGTTNFFLPSDVEQLPIFPKKGNPTTREKKGIAGTGVSRLALAERAKVAQSTVWNAFAHKPISKKVAHKLLEAFNELRQERNLSAMTVEQLQWNIVD